MKGSRVTKIFKGIKLERVWDELEAKHLFRDIES